MRTRATVPLWISKRGMMLLIGVAAVLNLLVVAATFLYVEIPYANLAPNTAWRVQFVLSQFTIVGENRLGVWYASLLLFVVSLAALTCFALDERDRGTRGWNRLLNYGWLLVAALFAVLSLDEAGSLHERIGSLYALLRDRIGGPPTLDPSQGQLRGWVGPLLVPIVTVALFFLAFAWFRVRRSRAAFALMILGTLLFLSIPAQEHFEWVMRSANAGSAGWERPGAWVVLEEGTEVFGAFCFFASFAFYAWMAVTSREGERDRGSDSYSVVFRPRVRSVLLTALGLIVMLVAGALILQYAVLPFVVTRSHWGKPLNWFPGILAFMVAAGSLYAWRITRRQTTSPWTARSFLLLALFNLFLSFNHGSDHFFTRQLWTFPGDWRQTGVDTLLTMGALLVAFVVQRESSSSLGRIAVIGWALLVAASLFGGSSTMVVFLSLAAYAALCFALVVMGTEHWLAAAGQVAVPWPSVSRPGRGNPRRLGLEPHSSRGTPDE